MAACAVSAPRAAGRPGRVSGGIALATEPSERPGRASSAWAPPLVAEKDSIVGMLRLHRAIVSDLQGAGGRFVVSEKSAPEAAGSRVGMGVLTSFVPVFTNPQTEMMA